jgi:hypothetical protein
MPVLAERRAFSSAAFQTVTGWLRCVAKIRAGVRTRIRVDANKPILFIASPLAEVERDYE